MAVQASKSNFSTALLDLKQEFDNFTGTGTFKSSNDALILDESGKEVLVRITTGRASGFVPGAKVLGFDVEDSQSELNFIEEFIPIEKINSSVEEKLEEKLSLGVIPVYKPIVAAGNATSQADFIQEANRVRASLPTGYDGTGIKVGVLSDSYNNLNGEAADILSGDLPNDVTVISPGGVPQDLPSGDGSDEGRAMLQLIHDLAPGADLSFATAFTGEDEFAANIRALADDGADIIVDDVIYLAEPFFQDGVVARAVDDVVTNDSVAYFSSAGNNAAQSYESDNFSGVADAALDTILDQGASYLYHDFNPDSAAVDSRQQIALGNNQEVALIFQWDDPFYTNSEVDTDLDIFLIDSTTNQVVAESFDDNIGNRTPYEYLEFTNTSGSSRNYDLVIGKFAGPVPGRIKYVNFGSDVSPEYFTNSSTIYGHAAATNAEAVGAVPYFRQNTPESFTSLGPTTFFYEYQTDAKGDPIDPLAVVRKTTPEIRQKPDLAAIDGTDTTFFGSPDFDTTGYLNFFGTSAAAPHAAAIAALLQESDVNLTPEQIYNRLESTAIDISTPGFDNLVGSGLVNAYDAIFGPSVNATLNFTDNFEDGDLPVAYETNSTGAGRIQVTKQHNPNGTNHLILDNSFANTEALNEVILHLDGTSYSNLQLSFDHKEFNDFDHPMSPTFTGSENSDGVALSVDGNNWYSLISLTGTNSTNTYQTHSFNLSDFATTKGLSLGSKIQLKFQQYGLSSISNDGLAIDNIAVTGTLNGGSDNNLLKGLDGSDSINGADGNDTIQGGNGGDVLHGNNGSDRLHGNSGSDRLDGDEDNDFLQGGDNDDSLMGNNGQDILYGDAGNDTLLGGSGTDILVGGAGNDELDGEPGSDKMIGSGGTDTFVIRSGDTDNIIYDFEDNKDLIRLDAGLSFGNLAITDNSLNTATEIRQTSGGDLLGTVIGMDAGNLTNADFVALLIK